MNQSNRGDCGTMDKLIEELNAKYSTAGFTPFKHSDVEHPSHYNMGGVETKEVIKTVLNSFKGVLTPHQYWCIGTAIKYLCRFPFKGEPIKDLKKAIEYCKFTIEDIEEEINKIE